MEDLGFRALGRGRALEGESEGGSAGEGERGREKDLVLIVVGPAQLIGIFFSSGGLSLKFETNGHD